MLVGYTWWGGGLEEVEVIGVGGGGGNGGGGGCAVVIVGLECGVGVVVRDVVGAVAVGMGMGRWMRWVRVMLWVGVLVLFFPPAV